MVTRQHRAYQITPSATLYESIAADAAPRTSSLAPLSTHDLSARFSQKACRRQHFPADTPGKKNCIQVYSPAHWTATASCSDLRILGVATTEAPELVGIQAEPEVAVWQCLLSRKGVVSAACLSGRVQLGNRDLTPAATHFVLLLVNRGLFLMDFLLLLLDKNFHLLQLLFQLFPPPLLLVAF